MFKIPRRKDKEPTPIEEAEKAVLSELTDSTIAGDIGEAKSYAAIYKTIKKVETPPEKKGMTDTVKVALISAGASLAGILAVIRHEELNAIGSKALGFITKPRI